MIVSRGVLDGRGSTAGFPPGLPGPGLVQGTLTGTLGAGSVLSLPYSSRTLLTSSSRSTGYDTTGRGRNGHRLPSLPPNHPTLPNEEITEEPPYETLPNIELTAEEIEAKRREEERSRARSASRRPPPPPPPPPEEDYHCHQDDSVISAHHSGIYDYIKNDVVVTPESMKGMLKSQILLTADLGDETRL